MTNELPSAAQIRAARALLGWPQETLAKESGISRRTLASLELGQAASENTVRAIKTTLEMQGIAFTGTGATEGVTRSGNAGEP